MARIPMTSGFALIPEGTYVFRIYDALKADGLLDKYSKKSETYRMTVK